MEDYVCIEEKTNLLGAFLVDDDPAVLEVFARFRFHALFLGEEPALVLLALRNAFSGPLEREPDVSTGG